jgi:hypothetical protein
LIVELVPSTSIYFHGEKLSINRWGMRDRDYEKIPAPNTYRIALTGPSFVMGYGVADEEDFDWLLEDRLNRENAGGQYAKYEILNLRFQDTLHPKSHDPGTKDTLVSTKRPFLHGPSA